MHLKILKSFEVQLSTGVTILVRSAQESDAPRIINYFKEILADSKVMLSQAHELNSTIEEYGNWIRNSNNSPSRLILLAVYGIDIIGMIDFENGKRERNSHAGIFGMSVQKHWRGKGIGKALLTSLLDWAEASDTIEKVCLSVFANNYIALNLYEKFGFEKEGIRPRSYKIAPGEYIDEIMMYKLMKDYRDNHSPI